jgi:hypothetical protein
MELVQVEMNQIMIRTIDIIACFGSLLVGWSDVQILTDWFFGNVCINNGA